MPFSGEDDKDRTQEATWVPCFSHGLIKPGAEPVFQLGADTHAEVQWPWRGFGRCRILSDLSTSLPSGHPSGHINFNSVCWGLFPLSCDNYNFPWLEKVFSIFPFFPSFSAFVRTLVWLSNWTWCRTHVFREFSCQFRCVSVVCYLSLGPVWQQSLTIVYRPSLTGMSGSKTRKLLLFNASCTLFIEVANLSLQTWTSEL